MIVVDASVAAMWFVPEAHSDRAAILLGPEYELLAPALIHLEVGSVLLKALRRSELDIEDCTEALESLLPGAVRTLPCKEYVQPAFDIAGKLGGSIYDALYIALALEIGAPLVTNDKGLAATARQAGVETTIIAGGPPRPRYEA